MRWDSRLGIPEKEFLDPLPLKNDDPALWLSLSLSLSPLNGCGDRDPAPGTFNEIDERRPSDPVSPMEKRIEVKLAESCKKKQV